MKLSKKPYKGCRDFYPEQMRIREYVFQTLSSISNLFGYEPFDGPLIEEVELYKAKSGEELINEQIYSFTDRGERLVAIRPEMTPTAARMVANVYREVPKPIRWFSIPNLMRYEKPQRGRLREHWQLNCDIFGANSLNGEVEIIQLLISIMKKLGANSSQFTILVNDRLIVDNFFHSHLKLEKEIINKLYKIIDKSKKISSESLDKLIAELALEKSQVVDIKNYLKISSLDDLERFIDSIGIKDVYKNISEVFNKLIILGYGDYITYDPTIVRGLDYYTGIVFECFDKNPQNPRAICGGGAYANLLQIFDESPLPGVGFGLGDVTLTDFLITHNLLPDFSKPKCDIFLSFQEESVENYALGCAEKIRSFGFKVTTHLEVLKFKKVFPLAEKRGAQFVAIIGEQEKNNKTIQFKNMNSKKQITINFTDLEKELNKEFNKEC